MLRIVKQTIYLLLVVSLLVGLLGLSACRSSASPQRMESYLLANYDAYIGLIRESPNVHPNAYWLYSDNYIASLALEKAESKTARAITQAIADYQAICHFPLSERWEALSGEAVPDVLFEMDVETSSIAVQGRAVGSEIIIQPFQHMDDWQEYADRLLLASINASNRGDIVEARNLFGKAQHMFDGTGFKDKAFQNRDRPYYDTYKLALYLIAAERVGTRIPAKEIKNRILSLQEDDPASNRYGGVYTEYDDNGKLPTSDTNTETTALVLFALN